VIKYKGRTVVCDAGVHPAFQGINALPYLDELDWSTVDAILITHFHLDHAASLTYIMEKVSHLASSCRHYWLVPRLQVGVPTVRAGFADLRRSRHSHRLTSVTVME
jgi:Cft2 family RNA processing exonuclease